MILEVPSTTKMQNFNSLETVGVWEMPLRRFVRLDGLLLFRKKAEFQGHHFLGVDDYKEGLHSDIY